MKKILIVLLIATFGAGIAFAQDLSLSGEVKTGVFWKKSQDEGKPSDTKVDLHSKDDAGGEGDQGRYRLNLDYDNGNGFGMKARLQWQNWKEDAPKWPYAFGYGNFFDDQMTVAIGKLGASPWGTLGPEKWKELETAAGGGMRIEWKPKFIPAEAGALNLGFVLNWFDGPMEASGNDPISLADLLQESVIGVSYTHDLFMVRFAWRLDSDKDRGLRGTEEYGAEGMKMIYRLEERAIRNSLPGFSIWALGVYEGIGAGDIMFTSFENWLFVEYAPEVFTAQVRLGFDVIETRKVVHVKPSFYWHFFKKLLSAGASFWYGQDFGAGKVFEGSPYLYMEVEPKIQLNFSSSYIAFAYNFRREYILPYLETRGADPIRQTQWMNLRFCIYY
jgi:hypothetical protein